MRQGARDAVDWRTACESEAASHGQRKVAGSAKRARVTHEREQARDDLGGAIHEEPEADAARSLGRAVEGLAEDHEAGGDRSCGGAR